MDDRTKENRLLEAFVKFQPRTGLGFLVPVTEHCNLNCRSCVHAASLVKEQFYDFEEYKKDISRLSELFDGEMVYILLMGGEPLLHPRIAEFIEVTREMFPVGEIRLVTNGILLPKMSAAFWETCRKCDAIVSPTEYPIHFDYAGLEGLAESHRVKLDFYHSGSKRMSKWYPIFPETKGEILAEGGKNYLRCGLANTCHTLRGGRMFTCTPAAFASHIKEYFNLDMALSRRDSVDIYEVKSGDELLEKLARPIPFCGRCDVVECDKLISFDWGPSKKNRYEWLGFEFSQQDMDDLKEVGRDIYVFGAGDWGRKAVGRLSQHNIPIKAVLATREKAIDNIMGVPIVKITDAFEPSPNSICLAAIGKIEMKEEVYPLLSQIGFGDVIPVRISW